MKILVAPLETPPPVACALQQQPLYGQVLQKMGRDVHCVNLRDGRQTVAQAQIVRRRFGPVALNWLARGPVWAPGVPLGLRQRAMQGLHADRRIWLGMADDARETALFSNQGYRPLLTPQYVAEIDLAPNRDTRLAAQHGKWRNRLRHAQKSGLGIYHSRFDPARDCALLWREAAQRRKRGYRALPFDFTVTWARHAPQATRLFTARLGEEKLAYLLLLLHRPTATYHIGWTGAEGRRHAAHTLLLWHASNWLAAQGYSRLDLGLVDTEAAPGLARFKIGSGAVVRPLGPTMLRLPWPTARRVDAAA